MIELKDVSLGISSIPNIEDFYHGLMNRTEAETILKEKNEPNTYLLRLRLKLCPESLSNFYYVLSYYTTKQQCLHFIITPLNNSFQMGGRIFDSLKCCLFRYYIKEIMPGESLKYPIRPNFTINDSIYLKYRAISTYTPKSGENILNCKFGQSYYMLNRLDNCGLCLVISEDTRLTGFIPTSCLEIVHPKILTDLAYFHPKSLTDKEENDLFQFHGPDSFIIVPYNSQKRIYSFTFYDGTLIQRYRFRVLLKNERCDEFYLTTQNGYSFESIETLIQTFEEAFIEELDVTNKPIILKDKSIEKFKLFKPIINKMLDPVHSESKAHLNEKNAGDKHLSNDDGFSGDLFIYQKKKWCPCFVEIDTKQNLLIITESDKKKKMQKLLLDNCDFLPVHYSLYERHAFMVIANGISSTDRDELIFSIDLSQSMHSLATKAHSPPILHLDNPGELFAPIDLNRNKSSFEKNQVCHYNEIIFSNWSFFMRRHCRNTKREYCNLTDLDSNMNCYQTLKIKASMLSNGPCLNAGSSNQISSRSEAPGYNQKRFTGQLFILVDEMEIAKMNVTNSTESITISDFPNGFTRITMCIKDEKKKKNEILLCVNLSEMIDSEPMEGETIAEEKAHIIQNYLRSNQTISSQKKSLKNDSNLGIDPVPCQKSISMNETSYASRSDSFEASISMPQRKSLPQCISYRIESLNLDSNKAADFGPKSATGLASTVSSKSKNNLLDSNAPIADIAKNRDAHPLLIDFSYSVLRVLQADLYSNFRQCIVDNSSKEFFPLILEASQLLGQNSISREKFMESLLVVSLELVIHLELMIYLIVEELRKKEEINLRSDTFGISLFMLYSRSYIRSWQDSFLSRCYNFLGLFAISSPNAIDEKGNSPINTPYYFIDSSQAHDKHSMGHYNLGSITRLKSCQISEKEMYNCFQMELNEILNEAQERKTFVDLLMESDKESRFTSLLCLMILNDIIKHSANIPLQIRWIIMELQKFVLDFGGLKHSHTILSNIIVLRMIAPGCQHDTLLKNFSKILMTLVGSNKLSSDGLIPVELLEKYREKLIDSLMKVITVPFTSMENSKLTFKKLTEINEIKAKTLVPRHYALLTGYLDIILKIQNAKDNKTNISRSVIEAIEELKHFTYKSLQNYQKST